MREVTFAKRLPKRRRNARRIVEAVLAASGYCFDIQRIYDIKVPSGKRYRYRFCVYDISPDTPGYDADLHRKGIRMGEDESKVLAWLKDRYCGNSAGLAYDLFMLAFGSLAVGLCLNIFRRCAAV